MLTKNQASRLLPKLWHQTQDRRHGLLPSLEPSAPSPALEKMLRLQLAANVAQAQQQHGPQTFN